MSAGDKTTVFTTRAPAFLSALPFLLPSLTLPLPAAKPAFGTIALAICFDIRFPQLLQSALQAHPDICAYLLPSAFNLSSGPRDWEILQRVRSVRSTPPPFFGLAPARGGAERSAFARPVDV